MFLILDENLSYAGQYAVYIYLFPELTDSKNLCHLYSKFMGGITMCVDTFYGINSVRQLNGFYFFPFAAFWCSNMWATLQPFGVPTCGPLYSLLV